MKKSLGPATIVFPTPVFVIGTYDKTGKPNAATVAWAGICCSVPPAVAVSLREATQTFGNILERKAFTLNIPSETQVKEADYFGSASGKSENKFTSAKLTPVKSELVDAPYVGEFTFILECSLLQSVKVGLHTVFIGQIRDIKAEESVIASQGHPEIEKIKPVIYNPATQSYYSTGKLLAKAFTHRR